MRDGWVGAFENCHCFSIRICETGLSCAIVVAIIVRVVTVWKPIETEIWDISSKINLYPLLIGDWGV